MPKFKGIGKIAVAIVAIVIAFILHWMIGVLLIMLLAGYLLYSNRAMLHAMRAQMEYSRGNEDKALQLLEKASRMKSVKPRYLISYGYMLLRKSDYAQAEQVLQQGLRGSPEREDLMLLKINLATAYWLQNKRSEALGLLEEVFKTFKNTMVYGNLGYLKILSGQLEEALALNLEAYAYNSDDQTITDNLAQNYYLLGRLQEAEEMYVKVMEKTPKYAESYYYYALTLMQLGKREEAREQSAVALAKQPALIPSVTVAELERLAEELGRV